MMSRFSPTAHGRDELRPMPRHHKFKSDLCKVSRPPLIYLTEQCLTKGGRTDVLDERLLSLWQAVLLPPHDRKRWHRDRRHARTGRDRPAPLLSRPFRPASDAPRREPERLCTGHVRGFGQFVSGRESGPARRLARPPRRYRSSFRQPRPSPAARRARSPFASPTSRLLFLFVPVVLVFPVLLERAFVSPPFVRSRSWVSGRERPAVARPADQDVVPPRWTAFARHGVPFAPMKQPYSDLPFAVGRKTRERTSPAQERICSRYFGTYRMLADLSILSPSSLASFLLHPSRLRFSAYSFVIILGSPSIDPNPKQPTRSNLQISISSLTGRRSFWG